PGSVRPWDWTRTDPSAAVTRYQVCRPQGLGAVGCMLSASFRPAAAAPAPAAARQTTQPLFSQATVQDPAPSATPGRGTGTGPVGGSTSSSGGSSGAGSHRL